MNEDQARQKLLQSLSRIEEVGADLREVRPDLNDESRGGVDRALRLLREAWEALSGERRPDFDEVEDDDDDTVEIPEVEVVHCAKCAKPIVPDDFGIRGEGPARQNPESGEYFCDDDCEFVPGGRRRGTIVYPVSGDSCPGCGCVPGEGITLGCGDCEKTTEHFTGQTDVAAGLDALAARLHARPTAEERQRIDAINCFGNGQHPVADLANLSFFADDYVATCLGRQKRAASGRPGIAAEYRE